MQVLEQIIKNFFRTVIYLNTSTNSPILIPVPFNNLSPLLPFQHNALRAICPATVNLTMGLVSMPSAPAMVWDVALDCFVIMVRVLSKSAAEERQIEVGALVRQAKEACLVIVVAGDVSAARIGAMLCRMVIAIRSLLGEALTMDAIRQLLLDNHVMDTVVMVLERSLVSFRETSFFYWLIHMGL